MSVEYAINQPLTDKQIDTLRVIANMENDCQPQDLDTILSRLSYKTTKQAFQFTIRSLINRELIRKLDCQRVRNRRRRLLEITPLGMNKLFSETKRATLPADPKTCQTDEIEKTDMLIAQIEKDFVY